MPASRLHQAIAVGNVSEVQKMLSSYDSREVEAVDDSGQTPLHLAISKGNAEIVRSLLRCRANIEAPDKSGWRPLHTACYQGLPEICELLLDAGAQPHSLTADANTPLHYLVRHSGMQRQTMERLVSRLATSAGVASPINLQNRGGDTPLHAAVSKNSLPGVHCLLKHRALPNVPNSFRDTPLHMAVRERAYEIGAALLQAGANPDLPGSQGSSRAMAAQAGDQTFLSIMDDPTRLLRSSTPLAGTPGTPPTLTLTGSAGLTSSGLTTSGGGGGGGGAAGPSESHSDAYRRFLSTPRGQEELARLEAISRDGEFITYAPDPRDPSGNQPPLLSSEPYCKVADYMIMPMHRAAGRTSSSAKTTTMTQLSIHNYMAQLAAVQQQTYRQIQPTTHMPIPSAWMMHQQQHTPVQPHDQQQYPPADAAEPYKLPPDRLVGRKAGESSQSSIAAEMARQAEAKAKEMEEAADKARQAQEAAEAARRAVAEAQEARLRFEREAEERRRAAERDAEQRRIAEEAAQRRAAEEAAQRQLAAAKPPPVPAPRSAAATAASGSEFSALTSAISSGLSLLGGFDRTSPASSTAASSNSHSNSNDDDDDSRDISSDDDDGGVKNKDDDDEAKRSTVVVTPYGASSSSSVAASSSTTSFGSQSMHSDDDDNTGNNATDDDDDDDWQQAEVDRYTRQLTEVINWLTLELNKRRVKTAQQLSDALREQAKPFLDTYGRREDLRGARELVMKLHEVLKRYDVEVEGAEERLGLEPFLKGRGSYAETMGPNSNRRRIISDSDESDDSDSRSYSDSASDDPDEFGGGYGASYSGI